MKTTRTKRAATNRGSCQCCGSVQKLPQGHLSTHGYTTRWGFFSGICQGSGSQPYEKSCHLIKSFIATAELRKQDAEALKAELLAEPAEGTTEAWKSIYYNGTCYEKPGYRWVKVQLVFTENKSEDGYEWMQVQYIHPVTGKRERVDLYDVPERMNPLAYVASLNRKYAHVVDGKIADIAGYIRWQEQRVAEWVEKDLLPLEGR